jgi:hypothetical protein
MRYFGGCRPIQAVFLASLRFAWRPLRAAVLYQASNRIVPYGAFTSNPLRPSQASLSVRLGILIHRGGTSRLIAPVASDPETRAWCGGALDLENGSTRSQFGYIFILVYLSWAAATNVPVTHLSCLFLGLFFSYVFSGFFLNHGGLDFVGLSRCLCRTNNAEVLLNHPCVPLLLRSCILLLPLHHVSLSAAKISMMDSIIHAGSR